jgi:hypothetical protein
LQGISAADIYFRRLFAPGFDRIPRKNMVYPEVVVLFPVSWGSPEPVFVALVKQVEAKREIP